MDEMSENWGRVPAQRVMNGGEFVAFWTLFFFFARLFVFFFFFCPPSSNEPRRRYDAGEWDNGRH